jgi:archaellum component FlaC
MTDQEILQAMRDLLTPINNQMAEIKHEITDIKYDIAGLDHKISGLQLNMQRGFHKYDDEIETLIAVLEGKGILPKAQ